MASIMDLPAEILLKIFQFFLKTESQKQLMSDIARVCDVWRDVCMNSSLWTKYDGTLSFSRMMILCKKGCLTHTKELIISYSCSLTQESGSKLFSNVTNVEMINFSHVEKFAKETFLTIAENCSKLKEIKIGEYDRKKPIKLYTNVLETFFTVRGPHLTTIQFSQCFLGNIDKVLLCLSDCCQNLQELHLTNLGSNTGSFSIKRFQMHCPKLKKLHLDESIGVCADKHSSGFPDLEVFTYMESGYHRISDRHIDCLLFDSTNLKFLSLTNCEVSPEALYLLPATTVEYLFVPRSKVCCGKGLDDVLSRWSGSLRQVDVSYSDYAGINRAIQRLVESPAISQLEYMNLNFTKIVAGAVASILQSCPQLDVLHLEGCRNLERGMKRTYSGKSEFKSLQKKLREYLMANPEVILEID